MPLWRRETFLLKERTSNQPMESAASHRRHTIATRLLSNSKTFCGASSSSSSSKPLPHHPDESPNSPHASELKSSRMNESPQDNLLSSVPAERHSIWWESSRLSATTKIDKFVLQLESSQSPRSLEVCEEEEPDQEEQEDQSTQVDAEEEPEKDMTVAGMWAFEEEDVPSSSTSALSCRDLPLLELVSSKNGLEATPGFELDLIPMNQPNQLNPRHHETRSFATTHGTSSFMRESFVPNATQFFDLETESRSPFGEERAQLRESFLSVNLANATQLLTSTKGKGIVKSGILFKQEINWLRSSWKARFVALDFRQLKVFTEEHGRLRCQVNLAELKPDQIEVMPADSVFDGQHATMWRFAIRMRRTRMFFAAYSERDLNDWLRALQIALAVGHAAPGRFTDLVLRQSSMPPAQEPRHSDFIK